MSRISSRFIISLMLAALLIFVSMILPLTTITAAETFPTDTTKIQLTKVLYEYDVLASWRRIDSTAPADAGLRINKIEVGVVIDADYADTSPDVIGSTRIHAILTSPDNDIVFTGFLSEIGWIPGNIDGAWGLSRYATFSTHWLENGTYSLVITYDILVGTTWTNVDVATHFMMCTYVEAPPDVPSEADPTDFLPVMLSFAAIAGMGFIGFNLARSRDPIPGLFMMFAGVVLAWGMGWLPTWVFVTAIALISILSAALWGKLFRGR